MLNFIRAENIVQVEASKEELDLLESTCLDALSYMHASYDNMLGYTTSSRVCLYTRNLNDNKLIFPYGLLSGVLACIKTSELHYNYTNKVKYKSLKWNLDLIDDVTNFRTWQTQAFEKIILNESGIILAPTGAGKTFFLKQIVKALPENRVVIVAPSQSLVRSLYEDLSIKGVSDIGLLGAGSNMLDERVTVTTTASLHKVDVHNTDLLLFDEVHTAAADKTSKKLNEFCCRRFGLSGTPHGRSDKADLLTTALFGPIIYSANYSDIQSQGQLVPIEVLLYNFSNEGGPDDKEYKKPIAKSRNCIWRNEIRNTSLAEEIKNVEQAFISKFKYAPQILILTSKIEHAYFLSKQLTDYSLVYNKLSPKLLKVLKSHELVDSHIVDSPNIDSKQLEDDFRSRKILKAIATSIWGTGVDFPGLDILVLADPTNSQIILKQWPGRVTRVSDNKSIGFVIALRDIWSNNYKNKAKSLKQAAEENSWKVNILNPGNLPMSLL